jgi:hypothetical protein
MVSGETTRVHGDNGREKVRKTVGIFFDGHHLYEVKTIHFTVFLLGTTLLLAVKLVLSSGGIE